MPEKPFSWVLAIMASGGDLGLSLAYAVEALVTEPGSLPGGLAAAVARQLVLASRACSPPSAMLLLMPDGDLASRR